jgi:hypothetical protein
MFLDGNEDLKLMNDSVWWPISGPVNDHPLALGDARTFDLHRDGIVTTLVFPHYVGQAIELHHHPDHRWYYASEQQKDEIWVFKCYDSRTDVTTGIQHHSGMRWLTHLDFRCTALLI